MNMNTHSLIFSFVKAYLQLSKYKGGSTLQHYAQAILGIFQKY